MGLFMTEDTNIDKEALIEQFLAGDGRERKSLLKILTPVLDREDLIRIAPVIRDPSPRVCARVTSLLARHGLRDVFEQNLHGLKAGKIAVLRGSFERIHGPETTEPE